MFYSRDIETENSGVFSVCLLNLPFLMFLSTLLNSQITTALKRSDSALRIYSKIRSNLERLLLENMEQSNSYSRTQNSKCMYEK